MTRAHDGKIVCRHCTSTRGRAAVWCQASCRATTPRTQEELRMGNARADCVEGRGSPLVGQADLRPVSRRIAFATSGPSRGDTPSRRPFR